ncbi:MAG: PD-(D/E)XK nuclease family protein [Flavobacteriaceae bacterium]|nr:PD-(D/E)XK nuclease family protein [Flavobacteriaceae bacterium]
MQSFLSKVTSQVISNHDNISNITFILPSKRAGLFLKTEFKKQLINSSFLPNILSIEEFIKNISNLEQVESITLIFEFYKVYKKLTPKNSLDSFDIFSKWATILLQDFNEIDSNLIDAEFILSYINDSKRIESWNLKNNEQTALTSNYLAFFDQIKLYYTHLNKYLLNKDIGYQGLLYRKAFENIEQFIKHNQNSKYIFAGFNALNKAEENIIHELLIQNKAEIFWDNDLFYAEDNNLAGKYFKKYKNSWNYYKTRKFNWQEQNINNTKNVYLYGLPKNITQIKKAGELLNDLNKKKQIHKTAVILGNEKLLPILLNSIPKEINHINITMGYDLKNVPVTSFFDSIFRLHLNKNKSDFYYKDFLSVLQHPLLHHYWINDKIFSEKLNILIFQNKTIFISKNEINELINNEFIFTKIFDVLFTEWIDNVELILLNFNLIINFLRKDESLRPLDKEYLFRFYNIFQQLINLNNEYGYIQNLKTLYLFYKQILKTENLSFQGEPLKGLQIMGVLESRVLDFENVIITSVNEGFLPLGGSQNSFIPLDIKGHVGLPTSKEKDSIYAYHFFRLFHRAKNIYILYNTETDDFGSGEQSRFITQLEIAKENKLLEKIHIIKNIVAPKLKSSPISLQIVNKTQTINLQLKELLKKGLSPSSLTLYIRNPIAFYKQKVLKLKEFKGVEETIAANTFGTIIHDTLEAFYTPYKNKFITKDDVVAMKVKLNDEVTNQFKNHYSLHAISSGKNYLTFEIAKQFLINFLNYEISELNKNKKIKILNLEHDITCNHQIKELPFAINVKGQIDRIDEVDGVLRIIDYKTGKVESKNLKINDWDLLITDEKYSKSFQVLMYAFMYCKVNQIDFTKKDLEGGIISFKNLKSGFMRVNNTIITQEILDRFLIQLDKLIIEICNQKIPFKEKEILQYKF